MSSSDSMSDIVLKLENGAEMSFRGRLFSEAMWQDEESGIVTHHRLYVTEGGGHVYSVEKSRGSSGRCRAFRVSTRGGRCTVSDGRTSWMISVDALKRAVIALCGSRAPALAEEAGEILQSAGC